MNTSRTRYITQWNFYKGKDSKGQWLGLVGIVLITPDEVPLSELATHRITATSPIVRITNEFCITESGSKYILLTPGNPTFHKMQELFSILDLEFSPESFKLLVQHFIKLLDPTDVIPEVELC